MKELKKLAAKFFDDDDRFVTEKTGYTIPAFYSQLNRLASKKERRPRGLGDYSKWT